MQLRDVATIRYWRVETQETVSPASQRELRSLICAIIASFAPQRELWSAISSVSPGKAQIWEI